MALGFGKRDRRHELTDLPGDWVGWLEPGIEVEGKLKVSSGLVRLNTHLKGEIHSEGTVVIHDQGEVEGDVYSKHVSITGKVKGSIHAAERIEIKDHGVVLGDIFTPCLVIDPGGYFDGQCHMPTPEPSNQPASDLDTKDRS